MGRPASRLAPKAFREGQIEWGLSQGSRGTETVKRERAFLFNLATRTRGSLLFALLAKRKWFPNFILSQYADCRRKESRGRREQGGDGRGAGVSDPSWVPLPGLIVFSLTNSAASCTSARGPPPQEAPSHPSRILLLNQCLSPPQITRPPTGFTLAPHGRSGARIQSIRRWNWRKSFCSTCISRGTAGTRWPGCSTSPRGR